MLRFFRSSNASVLVVIVLLGGLTWLHALLQPEIPPDNRYGTFLFRATTDWLKNVPSITVWIGFALTLTVAGMLITVNNKLHLIDKMSYLPGLCYLMLIGGVPTIHLYNPAVIATGLLIVGFMQLIESFDNERLSYRYFTAPIFIAAACFFYRYMYIYMLAVWFACLFYRPGYWREWVFSVLGFALPVFFAFCWFFLVKDDPTFLTVFFKEIFSAEHLSPNLSVSTVIFFGLAVILIIVTFGHLMRYIGSKKIVIRNGYYCIILIAIITLALSVIVPDTLPATWYLTAFPFSFVLSHYLATVRSVRWGTIVLTLLFIGVITAQMIYLGQFF